MKTYILFLIVVFSVIVSFSQTNDCITPPSNLVSWWKAEDNANDASGSNHGTPNGASYATGVVDTSFLFDGVNDVVEVPHASNLDITGDVTVELWVLQTVFNMDNTVLCKGAENAEKTFSMRFSGQTFQCVFKDNMGTDIVLSGPSFEDFQWHHYVYVRQGNQHQIYADGFGFGWEMFVNPPASSSGLPLTMGAQYNSQNMNYTNFFGGQMDEVSIYNRALSQTEIQSIYNAGTNGKCNNALGIDATVSVDTHIKAYPNPVKDILNIQVNEVQHNKIILSDIRGKVVSVYNNSSNLFKINMADKVSGMYFVTVKDAYNQVSKTFKIIKQ
ncbi:hypothetical protein MHTCC0001_22370 [Flavobacteriaceae bacterium MHTCC 0001]